MRSFHLPSLRLCVDKILFPFFKIRKEQRKNCGQRKQRADAKQRIAKIYVLQIEGKNNGADGGDDSPDVVAKAGTGGSQQRGKQRRQIHGEQAKDSRAKADDREPDQE